MSSLWLSLLTSIQAVLMFGPHSVRADFSDICVNSTDINSSTCIQTYEQLYNSLAKSKNSFNIESALYPAKRPSSVRVLVNIYGPNQTKNSEPVAKYTWSISCLYAALPATVLEILSLGSILVTHRTQTLNIQIPLFCCNISDDDDERRTSVKEMIEGVLAALQDLAVKPGIRDPKLNTAQCIIEGDKTDIEATGRSLQIRFILWSSFFFVLASCPLLANFLDEKRQLAWPNNTQAKKSKKNKRNKNSLEKTENNKHITAAKTICILCYVLAGTGFCILLTALICFFRETKRCEVLDIKISVLVLLIALPLVVFGLRKKIFGNLGCCSFVLTTFK